MKKRKYSYWGIFLAIAVGFILRVYQGGTLPSILNRDEAALAYNARLLLETGKDEWGKTWPLALESFGDYKLPGYVWSLIPFLATFGWEDWVVRFPSVIAGTVLIAVVYFWLLELRVSRPFAVLGAWLVALLPVSIFYSRMAYEANVGLTLLVTSLWLITSLEKNWHWSKVGAVSLLLLLGIFTYNTPWILLPFIAGYTGFLFFPKNWKQGFFLIAVMTVIFFIGAAFLLPLTEQKKGITIFQDETVWSEWIAYRETLSPFWKEYTGNRYFYWLKLMGKNFLQSFTPHFLVTHGDNHEWHRLPTWGHLTWLTYLAGLGGIGWSIFTLFRKRFGEKQHLALVFLFFTSLIPSIITVDAPHATRSLLFFILWVVFAVKGLEKFGNWHQWQSKKIFWIFLSGIIVLESLWQGYQLFRVYPHTQNMFQPGFNTTLQQLEKSYPDKPIAIVDPSGYHYILAAWYLKLPPEIYFETTVRQLPNTIGFRYGEKTSRYHFIAHSEDRAENEKVLIEWSRAENRWKVETFE